MLEIKGVTFNVTIEQKRIRNIYIHVKGKDVHVTAPKYVPKYEIYNFIESKRDWIYKSYLYSENRKLTTLKYMDGDNFYIFGEKFKLVKLIGNKNVNIIDNTIYLTYKDENGGIEYLYQHLSNELLICANDFIDKYRYMLDDYGYYLKPEISAKLLKSKWGVCFPNKNKINISSYLVHYPFVCLEYIIVHEMTHFIVPNHSKRFYEIVERNMPEYKNAEKLLKQ